jgi:hypothetical protein
MPKAQNKPDIDAHRFAGVLAGFDVCNASDEEALTKGLALRRMAVKAGMRIVDLLELPEIKEAIDDQLSPKRKPDPALRGALEQAAALREELTERTRDVRKLADLLRQREEEARAERKRPPVATATPKVAPGPRVPRRAARDPWWDDPVIGSIFYVIGWVLGILIAQHFCQ